MIPAYFALTQAGGSGLGSDQLLISSSASRPSRSRSLTALPPLRLALPAQAGPIGGLSAGPAGGPEPGGRQPRPRPRRSGHGTVPGHAGGPARPRAGGMAAAAAGLPPPVPAAAP